MSSVAFYISGHGFGHASRQIEVINALAARDRAPAIVVRTSAARWLFDRTVRAPFRYLEGPCDTGVVQVDSLELDERRTIREADAFHRRLPELAEQEAAILRREDVRLVIADAPPLACAAAALANVPAVVLANFTWDWIYEGYPEPLAAAPRLVPDIQAAYAAASAGWRLPMPGGFETVREVTDLPFIARHARHEPVAVRRTLALPSDRRLALTSFGGYGVRGLDLDRLDCLGRYGVVITGTRNPGSLPAGVHFVSEPRLYAAGLRYEDLVAAVDIVVTKPGFGIIAECVANDTAMLYTSRGRFREYDVMVAEMPRFLRCGYIDHDALFAGRWGDALDRVMARPPAPEQAATNGAEIAAEMIAERVG